MKKIKYILLSLLGIAALLAIWSLIEPYIIDKEEEVAVIPNLPAAWEGKRVGLIADLQVGMRLHNTNTISRIVEELIEERPALVLISGDFIYHALQDEDREVAHVVELVRPLPDADIPTYAVLGNHDYGMRSTNISPKEKLAARLETALEEVGIEVLRNEAVKLALPGNSAQNVSNSESLYLVGIDSYLAQKDKPTVALADVPNANPRIVMMHNPKSFLALPPQTAPVAVAGHTHGGQIRIPFTPNWSWLEDARDWEHVDGWSEDYGAEGNRLYINRGIGFSRLPIRFNCPPELTLFTLQAEY
ncbi:MULTISPECIES: metallophosphoesterase [unclassified Coleofasciculus]|uniref:metallophosphoesterase n=1 Tax=unclassified Coleofasciculus TaxID=2692782 RepID=UPI00187F8C9E|nr:MULTISPECIES: metallophosphoesterase [unclassified Coleofasciculus]MBE9129235.1 metallophosphoesterase [Coleofasciculus sp. LEGE 07081]MBE9148250.1 metallophosphoesterase [Coleofasciculus sp. LEGE 07092]